MVSLVEIVENTPGQGQGTSGLLAPMYFGVSSNPTNELETPIFRFDDDVSTPVPQGKCHCHW